MAMKLNYDINNVVPKKTESNLMTVEEAVHYIQNLSGMNTAEFHRFTGKTSNNYQTVINPDLFGCAISFGWEIHMINGAGEEICVDPESLLLGCLKGDKRLKLIKEAKDDYILETEVQIEDLKKKLKSAEALLYNLKNG